MLKHIKTHSVITSKALIKRPIILAFILLFAVVGTVLLINSRAVNPNLQGDSNGDNVVNIADIANILKYYGNTNTSADVTGDGIINIQDISMVLKNYGSSYTPPTTPQPIGIGVSGSWNLIKQDEFNGTSLNKTLWAPGWFSSGISGPVNDFEKACYNPNQLTMPGDGYLHMFLKVQQNSCKATYPNTGALISSNPWDYVSGHTGFEYKYGVVEWRVYLPPDSNGNIANWPGVWSNGQNWPTDGENDTMEGLGGQACYHFHSPVGGPGGCASGKYSGWHTFASNWQAGVVKYYYDGVYVGQITSGITSAPQYLIVQQTTDLQTAIPSEMLIDYVRVWCDPSKSDGQCNY